MLISFLIETWTQPMQCSFAWRRAV